MRIHPTYTYVICTHAYVRTTSSSFFFFSFLRFSFKFIIFFLFFTLHRMQWMENAGVIAQQTCLIANRLLFFSRNITIIINAPRKRNGKYKRIMSPILWILIRRGHVSFKIYRESEYVYFSIFKTEELYGSQFRWYKLQMYLRVTSWRNIMSK